MITLKDWAEDRQENGDDGAEYPYDYCEECGSIEHLCICETQCVKCGEVKPVDDCYEIQGEPVCLDCAPVMCGDCIVPIAECGCKP